MSVQQEMDYYKGSAYIIRLLKELRDGVSPAWLAAGEHAGGACNGLVLAGGLSEQAVMKSRRKGH